ncbi:MAG: hypothetical protein LUB63_06090 [Oscillospiraceae bacterium]|nr:hypothetical protein [Oscillospiraceae bacterium]
MGQQGRRLQQSGAKKKTSLFTKLYLLYVFLLLALCLAVFLYVRSSLLLYENSQPEVFMDTLLEQLAQGGGERVEQMCFPDSGDSPFEDAQQLRQSLSSTLQTAQLTWSADSQSYNSAQPVYQICADGEPLLSVHLYVESSVTRMGILTISTWALDSAALIQSDTAFLQEDGSYACTVWTSSEYTVLVNGVALTQEQQVDGTESLEQLKTVSAYTDVPQLVCYQVDELRFSPTVTVLDGQGQQVQIEEEEGGTVRAEPVFSSSQEGETMAAQVDVLGITETWSKLMTDDLGGARHSVAQVQRYLIPDSYLYEMAGAYASGIDITFVSNHSLDGFTGEKVSNCIQYSQSCFSCDVYFEKNMTLTKDGSTRTDVFYSRVYFVLISDETLADPGWYMADMQSILE